MGGDRVVSPRLSLTCRHWQLRDLICIHARSSSEVLYPSDKLIHCLDLTTGKDSTVAEFEFEPRCIQSSHGVIAAGGVNEIRSLGTNQKGLFAIQNRQTGEHLTHELGDFINNSVVLYSEPSSVSLKVMVCNNDHSLYFLEIEDSRFDVVDSIKLTSPLNHADIFIFPFLPIKRLLLLVAIVLISLCAIVMMVLPDGKCRNQLIPDLIWGSRWHSIHRDLCLVVRFKTACQDYMTFVISTFRWPKSSQLDPMN